MNKNFQVEKKGKRIWVVVRQSAHDPQYRIGSHIPSYGKVVAVREVGSMSYALTDAGEADMRAELKVLEKLNEDIDQLSSEACDCTTVAPELKGALDLAWYYAEKAMRDAGTSLCGHIQPVDMPFCPCCRHFCELHSKGESLRGRL